MSTVSDLLQGKTGAVASITEDATVLEAAIAMNERRIGSLVVLRDGRLAGIFTERDILQRVVALRKDASETRVGEVMTTEVACCRTHTTLKEVQSVMKNRRIRHLPVIDEDDSLVGLISIGDLNAHKTNDQESTIHWMNEYIEGKVL